MSLTLVIGGTRSGKSAHAERLAHASGLRVRYVATADGTDPIMAERIRTHAARRPDGWETVEAGARLADALAGADGMCLLLDGLGVWIAGALHSARSDAKADAEADVLAQIDELARRLDAVDAPSVTIVVAEQAGEGVLPADSVSRAWLDTLGEATQRLAARAERVELVVAGRALNLTSTAGANDSECGGREPRRGWGRAPAAAEIESLRVHGDRAVRPGDADHAVNVLAGGPPDWLRAQLRDALEQDAGRYPDEHEAAAALAGLHGRDASEIVPTNGGAEALWLMAPALRPVLAICVHPGFTEAEAALCVHNVPVGRVFRQRDQRFQLDPEAVMPEADLVIVGNPASPTGTLDPAAALLALRQPGRVVVVDEAFMDLVPGEPATLVRERLDDVIVVRSITKALAIPGLRAGYAVAPPALARRLREVRPPWSANALALAALAAAARRPDLLAAIAERATAERQDLERKLAGIGIEVWPSSANFCLIEVPDGPAVVAALRKRQIAVRDAESFPGLRPGYLRVTARDADTNARLAAALTEAIA